MTVGTEITKVQKKLHDNAVLWTRAELARWWNEGYRDILLRTRATKRFTVLEVPGRVTYAQTYEWEDRHTTGPVWKWTLPGKDAKYQCTYSWEAEALEGITPTASQASVTQPWERSALSIDVEQHFRFALPKDADMIQRVAWDDKLVLPIASRSLDETDGSWMREEGQPFLWTAGFGRPRTFEIFAIETDYTQAYEIVGGPYGIPRRFSGSRTYSQEVPETYKAGFAYTTPGDEQLLAGSGETFAPAWAYTQDWEADYIGSQAGYRFTWNPATDSPDNPSFDKVGTQPWEVGNNRTAGQNWAMFPWEASRTVAGTEYWAVRRFHSDAKPKITGPGRRFTVLAASGLYGTQPWENATASGSGVGGTVGTYPWESEYGATAITMPLGIVRGISSPDRQYFASQSSLYGVPRDWKSSEDALTVWHAVIPESDLGEQDTPDLIPAQMVKYLRYYVWSRAFGRQGEGNQPLLAAHMERRYMDGVRVLKRIAELTHVAQSFSRQPVGGIPSRHPAYPRLPPEFPSVEI